MLRKLNRATAGVAQNRPVKVLQFGGGNFLRGFADWIIDVLNEETDFNAAVDIVTSVTPGTAEQINQQQGLYHLIQQGFQNGREFSETRLITCINSAINPLQEYKRFLDSATNPDLRFIISNTTESGITFDGSDSLSTLPTTFPGKLTLLLQHRYEHFKGAADKTLIIIPCELIEANGDVLKHVVSKYAEHWNLSVACRKWIAQSIFCNTLVDRIVPGFPKEDIDTIQASTGFEDSLTVAAEPFYFWAIEAPAIVQDEFPIKRSSLTDVVFTDDITPYRTRKVRILNGAHTVLAPLAYLKGLRTVKECMDDPDTAAFIKQTIEHEIIPVLDMPNEELVSFAAAVMDRFRNPFIKHFLHSISLNCISKFKVRVLPTLLQNISDKKILPVNIAMSMAALICFYRGDWKGESILLNDSPEVVTIFQTAWQQESTEKTVSEILSTKSLWGQDLTKVDYLTEAISQNVKHLLLH